MARFACAYFEFGMRILSIEPASLSGMLRYLKRTLQNCALQQLYLKNMLKTKVNSPKGITLSLSPTAPGVLSLSATLKKHSGVNEYFLPVFLGVSKNIFHSVLYVLQG